MSLQTVKSWPEQAQKLVQQDPRKAGILAALALVLAFMGGRAILQQGGPAFSAAATTDNGLRVAGDGPWAAKQASENTAVASKDPVQAWLDHPIIPVGRNPFAIKFELFPPEVTKSDSQPSGKGFWDEIAKSLTVQVDQEEKKQEVLRDVQARASELHVASVIMGPSPRAMIDDKLVGEGDVVANFRVLKIEARRIIVESEGIRLEIQMK